jgi:hypothetical protein
MSGGLIEVLKGTCFGVSLYSFANLNCERVFTRLWFRHCIFAKGYKFCAEGLLSLIVLRRSYTLLTNLTPNFAS